MLVISPMHAVEHQTTASFSPCFIPNYQTVDEAFSYVGKLQPFIEQKKIVTLKSHQQKNLNKSFFRTVRTSIGLHCRSPNLRKDHNLFACLWELQFAHVICIHAKTMWRGHVETRPKVCMPQHFTTRCHRFSMSVLVNKTHWSSAGTQRAYVQQYWIFATIISKSLITKPLLNSVHWWIQFTVEQHFFCNSLTYWKGESHTLTSMYK